MHASRVIKTARFVQRSAGKTDHSTSTTALERVFLSYLRTSLAFSSFGVAAAQLFRLGASIDPEEVSSFFHYGKPVGAVSECIAILLVVIGAVRCGVQQRSIVRGSVRTGGWEVVCICLISAAFFLVLLVFLAGDAATGRLD